MKSHTTFRVGGPADYFVTPQTAEEVAKVIEACRQEKVPYYIVEMEAIFWYRIKDMRA